MGLPVRQSREADRPAESFVNDVRWNVDDGAFEVWDGAAWTPMTSGSSTPTGTGFVHVTSGSQDGTAQFEPDTDGTLAANSDTVLATQKATKTYADSVAATMQNVLSPPGLTRDPTPTNTALPNQACCAVYLGKATKANPTCDITLEVGVAYSDLGGPTPYAKIGMATGAFVANGAATLTSRGTVDVSGTFNSLGIAKTQVTTSGVAKGDDLWVIMGSKAAPTPFQVRGAYPDAIQSGVVQLKTATDPASLSGTAMTLGGTTLIPPWVSAVQS